MGIMSWDMAHYYPKLRQHIRDYLTIWRDKYDSHNTLILDIAPQIHEGAAAYFPYSSVSTLDIEEEYNPTFLADITKHTGIPDSSFDIVVCTEVLEHVYNPFGAVEEIYRLLKPGGLALASTPLNFEIHGPDPDCWRFTKRGLETLFCKFEIIEIHALLDENRPGFPIHYTIEAKKK